MSKQLLLAQERRDGKIYLKHKDIWGTTEMILSWVLVALAISVAAVCWIDGGPGIGMLASASAAVVIWKEGPR